jgi:hypothetical protein
MPFGCNVTDCRHCAAATLDSRGSADDMRTDPELDLLVADVAIARRAQEDAREQIRLGNEARDKADRDYRSADARLQAQIERMIARRTRIG